MKRSHFTKIVSTLGPVSNTPETIKALAVAGVNVFRLNFSHGSHDDHRKNVEYIRAAEKEIGRPLAILCDMQGPKLRIGTFKEGAVELHIGDRFRLDMSAEPGDENRVCLPHPEIFQAMTKEMDLLLNDGLVRLRVDDFGKDFADTTVIIGGRLSNKKGVNVPGVPLPIDALTEKDKIDLQAALDMGADMIGLSFVQRPEDLLLARSLINDRAWIVSKIEKPAALERLDEIIRLSDGIMVARGDLGVECPLPTVPVLQKRIVTACRKYARPVIIATQMLESMIKAPTPTRAEVSDVATAVYDGADAVMLSAETAAGSYPVEAVKMMNSVITQVENDPLFFKLMANSRSANCCFGEADSITFAASDISSILEKVACIVTYTSSGLTTFLTARERPNLPILAITSEPKVADRLGLVWGAKSFVNKESFKSFDKIEDIAVKIAVENGFAKSGDHIIITAGFPLGKKGRTNMLHTVYVK